jgi:hypothetical protein
MPAAPASPTVDAHTQPIDGSHALTITRDPWVSNRAPESVWPASRLPSNPRFSRWRQRGFRDAQARSADRALEVVDQLSGHRRSVVAPTVSQFRAVEGAGEVFAVNRAAAGKSRSYAARLDRTRCDTTRRGHRAGRHAATGTFAYWVDYPPNEVPTRKSGFRRRPLVTSAFDLRSRAVPLHARQAPRAGCASLCQNPRCGSHRGRYRLSAQRATTSQAPLRPALVTGWLGISQYQPLGHGVAGEPRTRCTPPE